MNHVIWFFTHINPDGWMGLMGSFIGVIAAFYSSLYFYYKGEKLKKTEEERKFYKIYMITDSSVSNSLIELSGLDYYIKDDSINDKNMHVKTIHDATKKALDELEKIPQNLVPDNIFQPFIAFKVTLGSIVEDLRMIYDYDNKSQYADAVFKTLVKIYYPRVTKNIHILNNSFQAMRKSINQ